MRLPRLTVTAFRAPLSGLLPPTFRLSHPFLAVRQPDCACGQSRHCLWV